MIIKNLDILVTKVERKKNSKNVEYLSVGIVTLDDGALVIMLPEGSPDTSSLERMLKTEVCEVCGQRAHKGSGAWNHIKMILDRPKKISTTRNDFKDFYGMLQKSASSSTRIGSPTWLSIYSVMA